MPRDAVPRDGDGGGSLKHEEGREDRFACVCVSLAEPVLLMVLLVMDFDRQFITEVIYEVREGSRYEASAITLKHI